MSGVKGANAGTRSGAYKHGQTKTRLFKIWASMHERCERVRHAYYMNYGGRGIRVCDEWREFVPFREWALKAGYRDDLSIDRIDVDGDYCPKNCRWATNKEQANNKRTNRIVEFNGEKMNITQWSDMLGINKTTLRERLNAGWSVEDALTRPVRKRTKGYRPSDTRGGERK